MWFRVAQWLHCTVSEAQARLTSLEFAEFMAFFFEEPWGYEIGNYRAGIVAATVANVAPRKKGAKGLKASDFYPENKKQHPVIQLSPRLEAELKEHRKRKRKNG